MQLWLDKFVIMFIRSFIVWWCRLSMLISSICFLLFPAVPAHYVGVSSVYHWSLAFSLLHFVTGSPAPPSLTHGDCESATWTKAHVTCLSKTFTNVRCVHINSSSYPSNQNSSFFNRYQHFSGLHREQVSCCFVHVTWIKSGNVVFYEREIIVECDRCCKLKALQI